MSLEGRRTFHWPRDKEEILALVKPHATINSSVWLNDEGVRTYYGEEKVRLTMRTGVDHVIHFDDYFDHSQFCKELLRKGSQ